MSDRVRIFSRYGIGLCDLRVSAERNWGVKGEGEAEFDIVYTDAACREDWLRFGNWLLIENNKLPPWVGMIDVPREWKRRAAHVHAYSPEKIFQYRNVPRKVRFNGKSGVIFRQILSLVNLAERTVIEEGEIWEKGPDLKDESLSGDNLLDYLTSLTERANAEFWFTPTIQDGKLAVLANWCHKIGHEYQFPLEEGYNVADEDNCLRVQNEFTNEVWGYGNSGGPVKRASVYMRNEDSVHTYGLRQGSKVYSDYENVGPVLNALKGEINSLSVPHNVFKLSALDVGDTFFNLRLGFTYPVRTWSVGFGLNTKARVIGMYYDPLRGKVDLTFEEVFDECQD